MHIDIKMEEKRQIPFAENLDIIYINALVKRERHSPECTQ